MAYFHSDEDFFFYQYKFIFSVAYKVISGVIMTSLSVNTWLTNLLTVGYPWYTVVNRRALC